MKNKHAKGPDGQPLININSGRGRGRPKKNAGPGGLRFSHIEPTNDNFFKASSERTGGPVEPSLGFKEVYTEIYIKRAKQPQPLPPITDEQPGLGDQGEGDEKMEDVEGGEEINPQPEENKEIQPNPSTVINLNAPTNQNGEKVKKKRGRKPKSFYIEQ